MASYHGRASIDANAPRALGVCERCGFLYNLHTLKWQFDWRGTRLQNLRRLVCASCLDVPQQQLRTIVLPPDPVPVMNPRPEQYAVEVPSFLGTAVSSVLSVSSAHLVTASSSAELTTTIRVTPYPDIIPGSSLVYFSYSSISS